MVQQWDAYERDGKGSSLDEPMEEVTTVADVNGTRALTNNSAESARKRKKQVEK